MIAYQTTVEIPFSATVVVDATLASNDSGVTLASQMLPEAERMMPFSGVLRLTDVSNASLRTSEPTKDQRCPPTDNGLSVAKMPAVSVPAVTVPQEIRSRYQSARSFFGKAPASNVAGPLQIRSLYNGPTIGPMDGIGYEVISRSDISKPTPWCGFNDLGMMILGVFTVETRRYTQYSNGALVASWQDSAETFKSCWPS